MTVRRIFAWPTRQDPDPVRPEPWMDRAACAETGDIGFYGQDDEEFPGDLEQAKKFCNTRCPVRDECREYAISTEYSDPRVLCHGVWGGMSARERRDLIIERKKAVA